MLFSTARISVAFLFVCVTVLCGQPAASRYPKIDAVSGFRVDPTWPSERAPGDVWAAMSSVTVGPDGNVWTFNRGKLPIQVYTPQGKLVRSWGGEGLFKNPHTLRFDPDGNLWASDTGTHTVRKFTPDGKLLMTLGTPGEPGEDATHFNQPNDQAFGPNDIYVSDGYGNNRIVVFDKKGKFKRAWGKLGTAPGEFSLPHSVALDSRGRVYVADRNNARIQIFDSSGKFLEEWKNIIIPHQIVITPNDEIYVCGSSPMLWADLPSNGVYMGVPPKDQIFMKLDTAGRLKQLWTFPLGTSGKPGELNAVHSIAVGLDGSLYFGDIGGRRAQRFVTASAR